MFKKSFMLLWEDALTYPVAAEICLAIARYCAQSKEDYRFISRQAPVQVEVGRSVYEAQVGLERGGYSVRCVAL